MCLVVIVDDRATNRAIYTQLARSIGQDVEVRAFGDPEEALCWLGENRVDLIVTDYDMPRIVGDEFISRFRRLPYAGGVPVMMVTICDRRQLRLRALESGATDFLQAPIDHFEFLTRARNLLKLSRGATPAGRSAPDGDFEAATRSLLERCAPGGYAFHFIEIAPTGAPPDLTSALRRHLRSADSAIRIDPLRYVLLQNHVAGLADAEALAWRLIRARASFAGVASLRMGLAVPGAQPAGDADATANGSGAEQCLRAARDAAREVWRIEGETDAEAGWGLAPMVDLRTGELAGVDLLSGGAPANALDARALRAALDCAREGRASAADVFRVSLRLALGQDALGQDGVESLLLRLPPLLAGAKAAPSRLDLILSAQDLAADAACGERVISALDALGVGVTLDLGAGRQLDGLVPEDRRDPALASILGGVFAQGKRRAIRFSCHDGDGVALARRLRGATERLFQRAPLLVADGAPAANLLSALRRAGASRALGPCFGAPFALSEIAALRAAQLGGKAGAASRRKALDVSQDRLGEKPIEIEARRA
jgi:CheY-like chemotaxis protein